MRLGITGTDTGVGKTFIATTLAAHFQRRGWRVGVMKPIETGVEGQPADAVALQKAAESISPIQDICPYTFSEPLAPMVAAQRAQKTIDLEKLDASFARASRDTDVVIVEGAGGLLVPITETVSFAALFRRWDLETIIVAANKLGALNHTLLTYQVAKDAGLRVRAIVLNTIQPDEGDLAARTNLEALRTLMPGETIVSFPGHGLVQLF